MTFRQLRIFVVVGRRLNLGAAADELRLAQPSVSEQLRLLEEELGTKLHRKTARGIELTPPGLLFLRDAKLILSRIERLKAKVGSAALASTAGTLNVGGSYSPSASLLLSLLARFEKSHPEAELSLRTDSRAVVERLVLNGEVDLAVLNDPPSNRHLTMEPYRSEPVVAFVHPNHPLAKKPRLNWEELGRVGFVIRRRVGGKGTADRYLQNLRKNGVRLKVLMRCDSPEAVKAAVKRNMGVGILFRNVVADSLKQGEFKAIKLPGEAIEGKSCILYHKTRPLSPLAQDFLKLLQTQRSGFQGG